jgi:tubulin epsilon
MPREIITIQVGQCGNQIGYGFWDLLLKEHAEHHKAPVFNDALSSFFKNLDAKNGKLLHSTDPRYQHIQDLKARVPLAHQAVVIDMETGVINHLLKTSRLL